MWLINLPQSFIIYIYTKCQSGVVHVQWVGDYHWWNANVEENKNFKMSFKKYFKTTLQLCGEEQTCWNPTQINALQWRPNALCNYPFVKMELEIQARFSPQHPFWRLPAAQFPFWIIFGYELNTVLCRRRIYNRPSFNSSRLREGCEWN